MCTHHSVEEDGDDTGQAEAIGHHVGAVREQDHQARLQVVQAAAQASVSKTLVRIIGAAVRNALHKDLERCR